MSGIGNRESGIEPRHRSAVILSEAKDPHRPERKLSVGRMTILRLTAQDDNSLYRYSRDPSLRSG